MPQLYTIGFRKKSLAEFIGLLSRNLVTAVVDVRLRNTSQLAGYAKRDDLRFLLKEGFGIAYRHELDLAPTAEILDAYREAQDWAAYEDAFQGLCVQRRTETLGEEILAAHERPCLLCSEPTADYCHRRLIAEYWATWWPDLEITHL